MCIALAERYSNSFLDASRLQDMELKAGLVALNSLVRVELDLSFEPAAVSLEQPAAHHLHRQRPALSSAFWSIEKQA
jgi:hypothetical protein